MENNYSMLIIWLFPLISGIIGFYLGKKNKATRNDWVDIVMFVESIMLGVMGYQIANEWSTLSMSLEAAFGFGLIFEMNEVRLLLSAVVTIVFAVVSQFMKESMKEEKGSNRFYLLFLGVFSMLLGAVMTRSIFDLFVFATVALVLLYLMIVHRQDEAAVKNGGIYLLYVMATVAIFVVAFVLFLGYVGAVEFEMIYAVALVNGFTTPGIVAGLLFFFVFAIYAGLFPVQFAVTRGSSYGLMEGSVILTSVISKIGIYAIMMLAVTMFSGNTMFGNILLAFSLLTAMWGLIIAFSSTDIRRILVGLDIAVNGFNTLGIALICLAGDSNTYATRGSLYLLVVSSLSLMVLYMVALELVRKNKTFEINGLIASGKGKKLLMLTCLFACVSMIGVPGTAGYLAYSLIFKTVLTTIGEKWLVLLFVVMWAFFMTAVSRVFMKLFVSKKEKVVRILSTEEEMKEKADVVEEAVEQQDEVVTKEKDPYLFGEGLLLVVGLLQIVIGVMPGYTVDRIATRIDEFFYAVNMTDAISYFTVDIIFAFAVAAIVAIVLYVNLVHGILLRAIRNRKNKELKERME